MGQLPFKWNFAVYNYSFNLDTTLIRGQRYEKLHKWNAYLRWRCLTSNELDCVRIKFCTNQGYSFKVTGKMTKTKSCFLCTEWWTHDWICMEAPKKNNNPVCFHSLGFLCLTTFRMGKRPSSSSRWSWVRLHRISPVQLSPRSPSSLSQRHRQRRRPRNDEWQAHTHGPRHLDGFQIIRARFGPKHNLHFAFWNFAAIWIWCFSKVP